MDSDSVSATALARRPAPCDDAPPIRISGWVTIGPFSRADPGYRVGHPNNGKWITKKGPPKVERVVQTPQGGNVAPGGPTQDALQPDLDRRAIGRSEEHTSELQSL